MFSNQKVRAVLLAAISTSLSACTTSQEALHKNPKAVSKAALCRSYVTTNDHQFRQQLHDEMLRRSISATECSDIVKKQNQAIAVGVALAAVGAAVAVCANNNCGGGGYSGRTYNGEADWDQFYNAYGQLVWACREVASGRFTYEYNCYGKAQTDWRWPSKYA